MRGSASRGGVCLQGGLHPGGWAEAHSSPSPRVCRRGGVVGQIPLPPQGLPQEGWADPPTPRLKKAGGTHPTGMLSCYHPQTKLQKRNVFTPVCQSFCLKGGVCLSACWDTPPRADTPHPNTHPADGHCSGRYACYWNAFWFKFIISHNLQLTILFALYVCILFVEL